MAFGASHSSKSPCMVLDALMDLHSWRASQICDHGHHAPSVTFFVLLHSLFWHLIFVIKTQASPSPY